MKQNNLQWISVEDELPKKCGKYLVCDKRTKQIGIQCYSDSYGGYSQEDKWFTYWSDEKHHAMRDNDITHWQPLPQPPNAK